jgi:GTP diphosphokinase / guanosine-3',5'-bis(diphosphate) 3'-diphosphatase
VRNIALRRRTNEHAYTAEVVALLLRDTVEDTDTRTEELRRLFGDEIAATVLEVTDDKSDRARPSSETAREARKVGRQISNLRGIRRRSPVDWTFERRRECLDWARRVVDDLRGIHSGLEAPFDEEMSSLHEGLE